MDVYKPVYPGLYYFDTFTFTALGTSGHRGPESTKTYANAPWSADQFSIVDGQQQWTVPATGTYLIEAAGAYGATPGRVVSGDVVLNEGQVVSLLVGQQPTPLTANVADATTVGGGGGTFIGSNGNLLMVASGGDGTGGSAASFSPYGTGDGKNGGGYLSNGLVTSVTFKFLKPEAYVDGGFGNSFPTGVVPEEGGFGGGQSPVTSGISGGGGYTGSAGDGVSGATCYGAGTITDLGATSNSAGYVTVSLIDPAPVKQSTTLNSWAIQPTTFAPATSWSAVAYGNGVYVSVSDNGTFPVMYSTNGIDWLTTTTGAVTAPWKSVTFGEGKFVAVGTNFYMYSTNGIGWNVTFTYLSITTLGTSFDIYGYTPNVLNLDGSIIAISSTTINNYAGAVYVYEYGFLSYVINFPSQYASFGTTLALSSDGTIFASSTNGNANKTQVYRNGNLLHDINTKGDSVALTSDGSILAVGVMDTYGSSSSVNVYTNGDLTYTIVKNNTGSFGSSVALNSDGSILAAGTGNPYFGDKYIEVYKNRELFYTINNGSYKFALNLDGTILAVLANGVDVYLNGSLMYSIPVNSVNDIDLSADGTVLAVCGSAAVFVYKNGTLTHTFSGYQISSVSLSLDGTFVSILSYDTLDVNHTTEIYNLVTPSGSWKSVAYGNGNFVAVSGQGDSIFSNNAINWTLGNSTSDSLTSVTYGNDRFIAVSNYGTTGNVVYSLDGSMWSNDTAGTTSNSWTSVSYGNGRFAAISSNATSMYSTDGVTWATGGSTGVTSNCLTFGNGYFVCPSSNSEVSAVSISTDSQTWTEIPLTYTPGVYSGVTYGANGYVAVSPTSLLLGFIPTFWVSPTQVANSIKLNSTNWSELAYGNGSFVAVGQGLIQTSKDYGNTWSSFQVSDTITSVTYSNELGTFVALGSNSYSSTDGLKWGLNQVFPDGSNSLTYGNGQFVSVLNSNVSYSRDGINWNMSNNGTVSCLSMSYGDKFSAVGENSSFMYSSDGINWNSVVGEQNFNGSSFGKQVALNSDGSVLAFVATGQVYVYENNTLIYQLDEDGLIALSSDGSVLAVTRSVYSPGINVYTNGNFTYSVPIDGNMYSIALSSDGSTIAGGLNVYKNGTLSFTVSADYYSFGYQVALNSDGNVFAFTGASFNDSDNVKVYINGMLTYTLPTRGDGGLSLNSDGSILAIGISMFTGSSVNVYTNGNFTYTVVPPNPILLNGVSLSSDGTILAVVVSGTGYAYVYKDGILTNSYPGVSSSYGVSFDLSLDGNVLAKGQTELNNVHKYTVSIPTGQWSSVVYGNGLFVAVGNPGGSMYSADGVTWFNGDAPTDAWTSVSYGDGYFVAVSDNGAYPVMYSRDGVNWSTTDPGSQFNNWGSVAFGGDTFLAIPTSGATTMTAQVTKTF